MTYYSTDKVFEILRLEILSTGKEVVISTVSNMHEGKKTVGID